MRIISRKWGLLFGVLIGLLAMILLTIKDPSQAGNRPEPLSGRIDSRFEISWFNLIP